MFLWFQLLINNFFTTVRKVKLEVRPLFLPQLVRLTNMLAPGLNEITWSSPQWMSFIKKTVEAIKSFDILVTR